MKLWTSFRRASALVLLTGALLLSAAFSSGCAGVNERGEDAESVQDSEWHYKMSAGYFESSEIPLAMRELHTSLKLNPQEYRAHYLLGFISMGRRKYPDAIKHFKATLEIKPDYHFAKNNLGTVYLAQERWRDAAELFVELLEEPLYPTPELAHNNLGWAYFNLRRYPEAAENFKMAQFLKPSMCLAYNNLGQTYEKMNRSEQAVSQYRRALRKCPEGYAEAHFNLAKLLQKQGMTGAREHFEKCVQAQPESNLAERCRQYLQVR